MENKKIAEEAFNYFNSGYNCAEAVLKSITDNFSSEKNEAILRIASPFCGGIGKTTKEICGALSGGIMAIGYLYGRSKPGENFDAAWKMTAKLRTEFEEKWGTTQCGSILKEFGDQENMIKCKHLTSELTFDLAELIKNQP